MKTLNAILFLTLVAGSASAGGSKSASGTGEKKEPAPKTVTEKKEKVCESQCLEYDEKNNCKKSETVCR